MLVYGRNKSCATEDTSTKNMGNPQTQHIKYLIIYVNTDIRIALLQKINENDGNGKHAWESI